MKKDSELLKYKRYGYDGDRPCAWFDELDVATCPRCGQCDIIPGQQVCSMCLSEIQADECDEYAYIYEMEHF